MTTQKREDPWKDLKDLWEIGKSVFGSLTKDEEPEDDRSSRQSGVADLSEDPRVDRDREIERLMLDESLQTIIHLLEEIRDRLPRSPRPSGLQEKVGGSPFPRERTFPDDPLRGSI